MTQVVMTPEMQLLNEYQNLLRIKTGRQDVEAYTVGTLYGLLMFHTREGEAALKKRLEELRKELNEQSTSNNE